MAFTEKYVTVTGGGLHDGSSEANAWTLAEGFANYAAGDRVNIKAGTYATTSSLNLGTSGSTTSPVVFRGYKTTIGDMDDTPTSQRVSGTDIPKITGTTGGITNANYIGYVTFQNLSFEYNSSSTTIYMNNMTVLNLIRCRITNDGSGACTYSRYASVVHINCFLSSTSTTSSLSGAAAVGSSNSRFHRCVLDGGNIGYNGKNPIIFDSVIKNQNSYGIYNSSYTTDYVSNCTFYNAGNDFIYAGNRALITNCVFDTCSGYAIRTNNSHAILANNAYHDSSFTSGRLSINDGLDIEPITLTSSPFVDAASGDLTIDSASPAYGKGFLFENDQTSYADIGAIQHADPSGGGGAVLHPLRSN